MCVHINILLILKTTAPDMYSVMSGGSVCKLFIWVFYLILTWFTPNIQCLYREQCDVYHALAHWPLKKPIFSLFRQSLDLKMSGSTVWAHISPIFVVFQVFCLYIDQRKVIWMLSVVFNEVHTVFSMKMQYKVLFKTLYPFCRLTLKVLSLT